MKCVYLKLWLNSIGEHGTTSRIRIRNRIATIDETIEVSGATFHPDALGLSEKPREFFVTINEVEKEGNL